MAAHFFRMNKSNVSFRNRLLIWQYEYRDAVIGVAFFCAFAAMKSIAIVELQANPVIATQRVMGVVEYVRVKPINPYGTIGHNLYYTYDLRLDDDNTRISVDDDVRRPHLVGSVLPIERQHHKHGADTYRLLNG
ncbi:MULTISPECIES: hypothetical protein [unclassified Mesorhizobium]|uniref:hypothetical protein n=1 Tax=unclassified Mesorhizobium TaxID=325217 RepID=UPI0013E016E8|nr:MULTISPECIES: hypothetical protein [unclassified Mesorhizobium]MCT2576902.1 hypothetical protein [Mesorhizobium sp. P13.3]MDF3165840.1 hypothetical protein [Mesorhizobium sp. P16.1]MDF3175960.1 hypothetical protein [Mesorhizobium sp. P17.1]MDF3182753.1 hypothetical protein [Mesorhizobium sp. ICCV3110.1]